MGLSHDNRSSTLCDLLAPLTTTSLFPECNGGVGAAPLVDYRPHGCPCGGGTLPPLQPGVNDESRAREAVCVLEELDGTIIFICVFKASEAARPQERAAMLNLSV